MRLITTVVVTGLIALAASPANAVMLLHDEQFTLTIASTEIEDGLTQHWFHAIKTTGPGINSLAFKVTGDAIQYRFNFDGSRRIFYEQIITCFGFGCVPPPRTQFLMSVNDATIIFETELPPGSGNFVPNTFGTETMFAGLMIFTGPNALNSRNLAQVVVPSGTPVHFEVLLGAADGEGAFRGVVPLPGSGVCLAVFGLITGQVRKG